VDLDKRSPQRRAKNSSGGTPALGGRSPAPYYRTERARRGSAHCANGHGDDDGWTFEGLADISRLVNNGALEGVGEAPVRVKGREGWLV
jgi:hypothetical protein